MGEIMGENLERKIFLICPVRDADKEKEKIIRDLIYKIELLSDEKVYYPKDHTPQIDPIGLNICSTNRAAIRNSKKVTLFYDPTSQGTRFDIGMSFMADKDFYISNIEAFPDDMNELEEFLLDYASQGSYEECECTPSEFYNKMIKRREEIRQAKQIEYAWRENDWKVLFDFGMIFMAEKPLLLLNREEVEKQRTPYKSFQNVLLALDDIYRQK